MLSMSCQSITIFVPLMCLLSHSPVSSSFIIYIVEYWTNLAYADKQTSLDPCEFSALRDKKSQETLLG